MGVGADLYMYVVVVQKFTFATSSPDEFLYYSVIRRMATEKIRYYNTIQQMSTVITLMSKRESENFQVSRKKIIPTKLGSKLKTVSSESNFENSRHFHV